MRTAAAHLPPCRSAVSPTAYAPNSAHAISPCDERCGVQASTHSNPRSGTGGETPTRGRRVTADVRFPLKVNLQELYFGCAKKLRINRTGPTHPLFLPSLGHGLRCSSRAAQLTPARCAVICNHCAGCGARPGALPNTKYGETLCKLCGG